MFSYLTETKEALYFNSEEFGLVSGLQISVFVSLICGKKSCVQKIKLSNVIQENTVEVMCYVNCVIFTT